MFKYSYLKNVAHENRYFLRGERGGNKTKQFEMHKSNRIPTQQLNHTYTHANFTKRNKHISKKSAG